MSHLTTTTASTEVDRNTRELVCGTAIGDVVVRPVLSNSPVSDALTHRSRRIWEAGDYDRIAAGFRHEGETFVQRLRLRPGALVLDVACGSGNLTIPAARTGAYVTGLDLIPSLLAEARSWSEREAMSIRLDEGNAEALPYADEQFDVVMSMFGVMFAGRPEKVVAELTRVVRPGGRVALANWVRDGFIGRLLALHGQFVPPPAEIPSPLLWGDESIIAKRFHSAGWNVSTRLRTLTFRYPTSGAGAAQLFRDAYGPTIRTFEALDDERREALAKALTAHWEGHARSVGAGVEVDSTYLEVVATRL